MAVTRSNIRLFLLLLLAFIAGSFTSIGMAAVRMLASGVLYVAAGPPIVETIEVVESPSKKNSVAIVSTNAGGATVDFDYEIILRSSSRNNGARLWRSYGLRPTNIRWIAPDIIEVTIPAPSRGKLPYIERWPQEGILILERLSP